MTTKDYLGPTCGKPSVLPQPLSPATAGDHSPPTTKSLNICGVMTSPRYVNCFARDYIDKAFAGAGIPLNNVQGVFYGQCMQRMLEGLLVQGVDVVVACDGDSLFVDRDIMQLVQRLESNPEVDAIASMQIRRGNKTMLASLAGESKLEIEGHPVKVSTAHFGLTAIDLRKLAAVEKPWFFSRPCDDGTWGDARIDDDIWFWQQWGKAGNSLYLDPQTRIGHLEEMVVMVHPQTYEAVHAYPSEWVESCSSN